MDMITVAVTEAILSVRLVDVFPVPSFIVLRSIPCPGAPAAIFTVFILVQPEAFDAV